jgi:hypothetical protein
MVLSVLPGRREQGELHPVRRANAGIPVAPPRPDRLVLEGCPGSDELLRSGIGIVDMEGEADDARHPATDLDPIERLGLLLVEQLERRATRVEDQPAPVWPVPPLHLGEMQRVSVERDRSIEVVDGQCDPDLMYVHELDLTNRSGVRETLAMTTDRFAATVSWGDFAAVEPDLSAAGAGHLDRSNGAALLATVRGDAAPRLHPVTVGIVGDGLFVFLLDSAKRRDLVEDGRFALHAHQDQAAPDEFSVRGRARLVPAGGLRERVAAGWFFEVDETYWLFELRVQSAILGERGANEWPPRYRRWSAATSG